MSPDLLTKHLQSIRVEDYKRAAEIAMKESDEAMVRQLLLSFSGSHVRLPLTG